MKFLVRRKLKQEEKTAFKNLRKMAISLGMKSNIPNTIKEYAKIHGAKYATDDYFFELQKEVESFYKKLARKAERNRKKYDGEQKISLEYTKIPRHKVLDNILIYTQRLKTLSHIANPNYYLDLSHEEEYRAKVGKRGNTLKSFAGSSLTLMFSNYIYSLRQLGELDVIELLWTLGAEEWYKVYKSNAEAFELVFTYKEHTGFSGLYQDYLNALDGDITSDGVDYESYEDE